MINPALFSSAEENWYTPPHILQAVVKLFHAEIDLDPCADPWKRVTARSHFTKEDNGLSMPWYGNVFMNPPYGRGIGPWVLKARYDRDLQQIVMLLPARTDTAWFQPLLRQYPICFVAKRLKFLTPTKVGNNIFFQERLGAPFPSAIVYRGIAVDRFIDTFSKIGPIMLPTKGRF